MLIPLFTQAEEMKVRDAPAQKFLMFESEYSDLKEIGPFAHKHVPALKSEAAKVGFKITGPVQHFYRNDSGKGYLEIAYPISGEIEYKGEYRVITKPAYKYYTITHKGPISGIGKSWDGFMTAFANAGKMQEEGIEIYMSGTKNLMAEETRIEIRGSITDMAKFKNCIIDGFVKGSQGKKAGLKKGDVILYYNGQPIKNSAEIIQAVNKNADSKSNIKITVLRSGEEMEFTLKSGKMGTFLKNQ